MPHFVNVVHYYYNYRVQNAMRESVCTHTHTHTHTQRERERERERETTTTTGYTHTQLLLLLQSQGTKHYESVYLNTLVYMYTLSYLNT